MDRAMTREEGRESRKDTVSMYQLVLKAPCIHNMETSNGNVHMFRACKSL